MRCRSKRCRSVAHRTMSQCNLRRHSRSRSKRSNSIPNRLTCGLRLRRTTDDASARAPITADSAASPPTSALCAATPLHNAHNKAAVAPTTCRVGPHESQMRSRRGPRGIMQPHAAPTPGHTTGAAEQQFPHQADTRPRLKSRVSAAQRASWDGKSLAQVLQDVATYRGSSHNWRPTCTGSIGHHP